MYRSTFRFQNSLRLAYAQFLAQPLRCKQILRFRHDNYILGEHTMSLIDDLNKEILNNIQVDFPIDARPYKVLAEKLGLEEDE